jgi:hypothetical protein
MKNGICPNHHMSQSSYVPIIICPNHHMSQSSRRVLYREIYEKNSLREILSFQCAGRYIYINTYIKYILTTNTHTYTPHTHAHATRLHIHKILYILHTHTYTPHTSTRKAHVSSSASHPGPTLQFEGGCSTPHTHACTHMHTHLHILVPTLIFAGSSGDLFVH